MESGAGPSFCFLPLGVHTSNVVLLWTENGRGFFGRFGKSSAECLPASNTDIIQEQLVVMMMIRV
jgi:hypothetical protein